MAGYLGTKAVLLSTTAADVIGNAEVGGSLTVGGNFTSTGIDDNASSTAITIDGSQNVGIGTSSPDANLEVENTSGSASLNVRGLTDTIIRARQTDNTGFGYFSFGRSDDIFVGGTVYDHNNDNMRFNVNNSEKMRIDSSGRVGIGTSAPSTWLDVDGTSSGAVRIKHFYSYAQPNWAIKMDGQTGTPAGYLSQSGASGGFALASGAVYYGGGNYLADANATAYSGIEATNGEIRFRTATGLTPGQVFSGGETMRIDSSGNLLVGKTASSTSAAGFEFNSSIDVLYSTRDAGTTAVFNRLTDDGEIVKFRKNGTTVGGIGIRSGVTSYIVLDPRSGGTGLSGGTRQILPTNTSGIAVDNVADLGASTVRWDDIYATNGTIQTSDRNEKQDIEVLNAAETAVAQACKGLLRKFRWKDAVAEKGDDARIHFGIIAQDLQDAFAAEGLDAGRYAMFISSTWWETQTDVPAVEAVEAVYEDVTIPAVLDEDGNEVEPERVEQQLVTEAVEAKEAYTRTDTYETLEEAPEGATERTRLGVRYPELLAFIIGAM